MLAFSAMLRHRTSPAVPARPVAELPRQFLGAAVPFILLWARAHLGLHQCCM